MQRAGWLQSFSGALGSARVDEGSGDRDDSGTSQGEVPGSQAADHLRQRPAVYRTGLQGVHSHLGDDTRAHLAVLSTVEWENRALAQVAQTGVHPAPDAAEAELLTAQHRVDQLYLRWEE